MFTTKQNIIIFLCWMLELTITQIYFHGRFWINIEILWTVKVIMNIDTYIAIMDKLFQWLAINVQQLY